MNTLIHRWKSQRVDRLFALPARAPLEEIAPRSGGRPRLGADLVGMHQPNLRCTTSRSTTNSELTMADTNLLGYWIYEQRVRLRAPGRVLRPTDTIANTFGHSLASSTVVSSSSGLEYDHSSSTLQAQPATIFDVCVHYNSPALPFLGGRLRMQPWPRPLPP